MTIFTIVFLALMFFDGILIAFANIVDIDCGGTDITATQYNLIVDDKLRNSFNSIHEGFFNLSMIIFAPLMALSAYFLSRTLSSVNDSAYILATLAFIFLVLSIVSLYQYNMYMPSKPLVPPKAKGSFVSCSEAKIIFTDLKDGMLIVWRFIFFLLSLFILISYHCFFLYFVLCIVVNRVNRSKRIRWRIIFLALETACEDAMVSLIIAEYSVRVLAGNTDFVKGNLYAAAVVACGKFGLPPIYPIYPTLYSPIFSSSLFQNLKSPIVDKVV